MATTNKTNKVKIFLADDHAILREGLRYILKSVPDYEIIGECGDGKEALEQIEKLKPDIAVLDISMPTMSGIEISRAIKKYNPNIKIIIFTRHDDEEYINQVMKFGVNAYILKDNTSEDFLKAVIEVLKGNIYISSELTSKIINNYYRNDNKKHGGRGDSIYYYLSNREIEILKLIAEGKPNKKVALVLRISDKTVKAHRANIMKKLNVHKAADLVKCAIKYGLTET